MEFLLFSGATSLTAPEIASVLRIDCGRTLPRTSPDVIINYGAGTFTVPNGVKVINHPSNMKNKLSMLNLLSRAQGVIVPPFCNIDSVNDALRRGTLQFPIIGRTNMHQAGGGFWLCLDNRVVNWAKEGGANYFQQWKSIKTEYRVHVFNGEDVGVYKKVLRQNPKDEFCAGIIKEIREDRNDIREEDILKIVKKAVRHFVNPDFNIRSLHRGWKFQKDTNPPRNLVNMAITAVKAAGLDFAAVDMMLLENNDANVIELNTGPGMDIGGSTFNAYIAKFRQAIQNRNVIPTTPIIRTRLTNTLLTAGGRRKRKGVR